MLQDPSHSELADFNKGTTTAHLDCSVSAGSHINLRSRTLSDRHGSLKAFTDQDRGRTAGFILGDAGPCRKGPRAEPPGGLIFPGPCIEPRLVRLRGQGIDFGHVGVLLEPRENRVVDPGGPRSNPRHPTIAPSGDLPGRRAEDVHRSPDLSQQPRGSHQRVARKRDLRRWDEDRKPSVGHVIDEHGLAEAELDGDAKAPISGN